MLPWRGAAVPCCDLCTSAISCRAFEPSSDSTCKASSSEGTHINAPHYGAL